MIGEIRQSDQKEIVVRGLGVYELRALARELGVPSPTTKKRDELISLILQSFENGGNKDAIQQKRGRPFKRLASLDGIVNSVAQNEQKEEVKYESVIRFAQEEKPLISTLGNVNRVEGIASKNEEKMVIYSFDGKNKAFVENLDYADKIASGDIVEISGQEINGTEDYNAMAICTINGQIASVYQPTDYQHGQVIISNKQIPTGAHLIFEGRRNACLTDLDLYENEAFADLVRYSEATDSKLVIIGANTSFENKIFFKQQGIKYDFTSAYDEKPAHVLRQTINALNFADATFNSGENVIIVVADMGGLLQGLDKNFEGDSYASETQVIAKKLVSLAGSFESGKSVTLVVFYNDLDRNDQFLQNDILRICKRS